MNLSGRAMGFYSGQWEWQKSAAHLVHLQQEPVPQDAAYPQPNPTGQQLQPPTAPAPGGVGIAVHASSLKWILSLEGKQMGLEMKWDGSFSTGKSRAARSAGREVLA